MVFTQGAKRLLRGSQALRTAEAALEELPRRCLPHQKGKRGANPLPGLHR